MGAAKKPYFESVRIGEELPPLLKPAIDRVAIARYAGATDDYNPFYVDEDFAKRSGFPSVCAPGMMAMGFLGELAADWVRPGPVKRISARFVKIIWPGDSLVCRGRIVDKRREAGEHYVDLELWVENQKGELVVKGTASARLFNSASDEERHRMGMPPEEVEEFVRPSLVELFERELPRMEPETKAGKSRQAEPMDGGVAPKRASRAGGSKARK
ncbi:MaoC/PaaZ C-terminal domain-containing protein [Vulgatibacter incomptus]|uniref:MaoC family protein n=1 Tax=Vulgatibacter incomptus TaxID=1391653 RepID=A0A0K1PC35_9BACT|nr:MaoC/PaaZ C-terminal domain-containing protein [Vulgatibacter incomptus]AKU91067.1 MaoC family protein [Vulgatibacter incomptus]